MSRVEQPSWSSTPLKESESFEFKNEKLEHSVDDLLEAIEKNISTTSINAKELPSEGNSLEHDSTGTIVSEVDPSPIRPLNLKQHTQLQKQMLSSIFNEDEHCDHCTPLKGDVMQDIPRVPSAVSFDELEFNTRINRTSSLSRLSGPRQISNSVIVRTFSAKLSPTNDLKRSARTTADNSPSKKSVCFEDSPPKVIKYDQLTPENSDNSLDDDSRVLEDTFDSKWEANIKLKAHPLPPLPPKHIFQAPSPTKDTSLGSSDDSQDFNLTKEDLKRSAMSLEQRLDLVLNNSEVSERVQNDESFRGSGSPLKSMTQKEEELIYNIKNKERIKEEEEMRHSAENFEQDLRNNDKESLFLRLDPELRRRNSNSSLKEEERSLPTNVVVKAEKPIVLEHGMKTANFSQLQISTDDLISESTKDSFASATEIIDEKNEEISFHHKSTAELTPLPSKASTQSIFTINNSQDNSLNNTPESHKKQLSISDSITSGLSYLTSFMHKRTESGHEIKLEASEPDISPSAVSGPTEVPLALKPGFNPSPVETATPFGDDFEQHESHREDNDDLQSVQSSVGEYTTPFPSKDVVVVPSEEASLIKSQTEHSTPILEHCDITAQSMEQFQLAPPFVLEANDEEAEISFTDEFKATGIFNSSDFMDQSYTRGTLDKVNIFEEIANNNLGAVESEETFAQVGQTSDELNEATPPEALQSLVAEQSRASFEEPVPVSPVGENTMKTEPEDSLHLSETLNIQTSSEVVHSLPEVKAEILEVPFVPSEKEESVEPYPEFSGEISPSPLDDEQDSKFFTHDEYRSLKPSLSSEKSKTSLPSYNSLLFHDKEPEPEKFQMPATDYIAIWNSQPKPSPLEPKYSVRNRKPTPPKKVLKLLSRTFDDSESEDEIESPPTRYTIKREGSLGISARGNSFVTKSVSRSSFINLDTERKSSIIEKIKSDPDASEISNYSAFLPDISDSSNFANAFKEWDLAPTKTATEEQGEMKKPDPSEVENIKSIWGTNEIGCSSSESRTPSFDAGKLNDMLSKNDPTTEGAQVKSSNAQTKAIVENSENLGVTIEYDQDTMHDFYDEPSIEKVLPVQNQLKESLTKQQQMIQQHSFKVVHASPNKPIQLNDSEPIIINHRPVEKKNSINRLISGNSHVSGFDLADDFDRVVQLQDHKYAVLEKKEIIVAGDDQESPIDPQDPFFNDVLNQEELSKPMVPPPKDILYEKTRHHLFGTRVPSARQPLGDLSDNNMNIKREATNLHSRLVSIAKSNRNVSTGSVVHGAEEMKIEMKKQRQQQGDLRSIDSQQSLARLPNDDKGRLYLHINSLTDVHLEEIPAHKATFKLYLDNGKHRISTPKMSLTGSTVELDKEFEVAIEEDITDFYLTIKVAYCRPENELVEVFEKIPVKNNRFSRVFGIKPKYKVEKSYVSRKRVTDSWDNRFANDGSFAKNKIAFDTRDNEFTGNTMNYIIELFNEWSFQEQSGKSFKVPPYLVAKLDVTMLYIPRTSPLETLPPSIKVAKTVAHHLVEQENVHFEGFMFQEGGDCDLWKRRFFKIEGTKLIAHNDTTKKPRAQINLLKVVDIMHNGKKRTNNLRNITEEILMSDTFKLVFKNGEIIHFNAETTEARNRWIGALERVVELNRFHQPWVKMLAEKERA